MSLHPKTNPETSFEQPGDGVDKAVAATPASPAAAFAGGAADTSASASATASGSTAVATQGTRAVTSPIKANPFNEIKNALTVDYNTLMQVSASNGAFLDKAAMVEIGKVVTLAIMSFQDNYVISTGAAQPDEQAKKLVRYSDDGKYIARDQISVEEYINQLKEAGYLTANMNKRCILVGALESVPEAAKQYQDTLVQIDMPPSSKTNFDRYQIQTSYDIGRGKYTAEAAMRVELTAQITKNAKNNIYTVITFKRVGA